MEITLLTDLKKFKKFKKSSTFYRKIGDRMKTADVVKSNFEGDKTVDKKYIASTSNVVQDIKESADKKNVASTSNVVPDVEESRAALDSILLKNLLEQDDVNFDCWSNCDAESSDNDDVLQDLKDECIDIQEALKEWALTFNICHNALKALLDILIRSKIPNILEILEHYWKHQEQLLLKRWEANNIGIQSCLEKCLCHVENPMDIALNFNIDGLPIHNSSKMQFWPILFSIHDSNIEPMVIGIYCGEGKPPTPDEFLTPFVNELLTILNNGIIINGYKINIHIRCFICDTPVRSFIKGNKLHVKYIY